MSDLVVTVPKWFWPDWIAEGDAAGEPPTGEEWGFFMGGTKPDIGPGDRLYIVAHGFLRGYAPCTRLVRATDPGPNFNKWCICREGGAVAVTLRDPNGNCDLTPVKGFQGWRRRWWDRSVEFPFVDWKTRGVR